MYWTGLFLSVSASSSVPKENLETGKPESKSRCKIKEMIHSFTLGCKII
jgi:hypothetical protein